MEIKKENGFTGHGLLTGELPDPYHPSFTWNYSQNSSCSDGRGRGEMKKEELQGKEVVLDTVP